MRENKNRKVPPAQLRKAIADLRAAFDIDPETSFEIVVQNNQVVVKHVIYTPQESGVMSGEFWTEVVAPEES